MGIVENKNKNLAQTEKKPSNTFTFEKFCDTIHTAGQEKIFSKQRKSSRKLIRKKLTFLKQSCKISNKIGIADNT